MVRTYGAQLSKVLIANGPHTRSTIIKGADASDFNIAICWHQIMVQGVIKLGL